MPLSLLGHLRLGTAHSSHPLSHQPSKAIVEKHETSKTLLSLQPECLACSVQTLGPQGMQASPWLGRCCTLADSRSDL